MADHYLQSDNDESEDERADTRKRKLPWHYLQVSTLKSKPNSRPVQGSRAGVREKLSESEIEILCYSRMFDF